MATNLFAAAKVIEPKQPKTKDAKKGEIVLQGLEDYAIIDSVIKNLTTMQKTIGSAIREQMVKHFSAADKRPENFRGIDGSASASCEMKKRATTSPLNDSEKEQLTALGIPYEKVDTVTEQFVINPKYSDDQELLKKISDALSKVKDLPEDFIQLQKGATKYVITDESIDTAYEKKCIKAVIDVVGVFSIKPKVEQWTIEQQIEKAKKLLCIPAKKAEKLGAKS